MPRINTAAVQFKLKMDDYKNKEIFRKRIYSIMDNIRSSVDASCPLLVAFPEDIGTPMLLFGMFDSVSRKKNFAGAVQSIIMANLLKVLKYKIKHGVSFIRSVLLAKGLDMERDYIDIFSSAAKDFDAYIAAGSITLPDVQYENGKRKVAGRDVYNVSYFFGPDSIIGRQKKVHLVDFEGKSGFDLSPGNIDDIDVFDTPFGRVGIAICLDAFKEDVCDKLQSKGCDILVQPSANNREWSAWQQQDWLNGSYLAARVKKKFKYAINPMMNGHILDLSFEGQSSIISSSDTDVKLSYAKLPPVDGFIKIAKHHNTEEVLISSIEL